MPQATTQTLTDEQTAAYHRDGYVVIRGLFSRDEVAKLRDHYMTIRASGSYKFDTSGTEIGAHDPQKKYPIMMHMHRWDETSLRWLLDRRLNACMTSLLGEEPLAVQTMMYFKPPGSRGQALHQDQTYLRVRPGTCIAAWMALDACDLDNGCMHLVPESHKLPLLCHEPANPQESGSEITVPLRPGMKTVPAVMEEGDVLFFNGFMIHGSRRNNTTDRFRRALIGHYLMADSQYVAKFYVPALRMDGSVIQLGLSAGGGPCVAMDRSPAQNLAATTQR